MRKKLDTRFPASRIKKIMQADEDVGKIALAVPVLVSKALELFLQDLCDRTYGITLQRGMKTMSALHLKQCVHSFNVFDFLKDIVSKVPDMGSSDPGGDDRSAKRRKAAEDDNDSEEDLKRKAHEAAGHSSGGRGWGRGRGRGRGARGVHGVDRDGAHYDKYEDDPGTSPQHSDRPPHMKSEIMDDSLSARESKETTVSNSNTGAAVRNFDLNLDLDENGDTSTATASATATATATSFETDHEMKHEECPGWSLADMDKMAIDPIQFALSNRRLDEEEEDYDNEES
ncbi:uncharacterized protein [Elaeis guineensis]|uniref:Dr1-associated corepressor isoform X2 n=1 Tax=Elaeis guineensis var. tenera TaxID=51953 RepID=A0A6I9QBE9_ELAGV|nr:dr1-associated corepressor isoform X2 [Elaeis guineensis]